MKLFVYGTLQRGYGNNRLLAGATFLGPAVSLKPYVLFNCGFPYAVPFTKNEEKFPLLPITGEVYGVDETILRGCDRLEGHPNWYKRTYINVVRDDEEEEVMIYEMNTWEEYRLSSISNSVYCWAG